MKRRSSASGNELDRDTPSRQSRRAAVAMVRGERGRLAKGGLARGAGAADQLHRKCFMAHTRSYTKGSRMHAYLARHSASGQLLPRTLQMAFAIGLLSCLIISGPNAVVSTAGAATAAPRAAAKDAHKTVSLAHVYLMRGLMNVFSLGMDQLAVLIARHGIEASVHNHAEAEAVVSEIAARYSAGDRGSIILIGHSLGADAVMTMAQSLDRVGIPVALVVPFDGTNSFAASKNVACVLNITQRTFAYMHSGAGFHGELTNVNVSGEPGIDHFTIDKSPQLQALVMKSVLQAASAQSCRPGVDAPVPHAAAQLRRRGFEGLTY